MLSTTKNAQISLCCHFNEIIIKESGTRFQPPALSQKHVTNIFHTARKYLTKFYFDSVSDSKEINISDTSIM